MTDMKSLWRNQKAEETVTLENIHDCAARFQKRIRRALWIEYIAAAFVVVVFGLYVWFLPGSLLKAGSALCIVGMLYVVWQMRKRMAVQAVPELSRVGLVEFHRHQLVRQRDAVKSAWLWYMLPFVPGIVLMTLGRWYQSHASWRSLAWDHEVIILGVIIAALIFGIVRLVQLVRVAKLQRKIDELDTLSK